MPVRGGASGGDSMPHPNQSALGRGGRGKPPPRAGMSSTRGGPVPRGGSMANRGGMNHKMGISTPPTRGGANNARGSRGMRGGRYNQHKREGMNGGMNQKHDQHDQAQKAYEDAHNKYTDAYNKGDQKSMMQHAISMRDSTSSLAQMNPQVPEWSQLSELMHNSIQDMGGEEAMQFLPGMDDQSGYEDQQSYAKEDSYAQQDDYGNEEYGQEAYGAGEDQGQYGTEVQDEDSQFALPPKGDDNVAASSNGAGGRFGDPIGAKSRIGLAGAGLNPQNQKPQQPGESQGQSNSHFAPPPTGDDSVATSSNGAGGRFGDPVPGHTQGKPQTQTPKKSAQPSSKPGKQNSGAYRAAPPPVGDDSVAASSNGAGGRFGE